MLCQMLDRVDKRWNWGNPIAKPRLCLHGVKNHHLCRQFKDRWQYEFQAFLSFRRSHYWNTIPFTSIHNHWPADISIRKNRGKTKPQSKPVTLDWHSSAYIQLPKAIIGQARTNDNRHSFSRMSSHGPLRFIKKISSLRYRKRWTFSLFWETQLWGQCNVKSLK